MQLSSENQSKVQNRSWALKLFDRAKLKFINICPVAGPAAKCRVSGLSEFSNLQRSEIAEILQSDVLSKRRQCGVPTNVLLFYYYLFGEARAQRNRNLG